MRTRQDIEKLEDKMMVPYAMRSKDSGGRKYSEAKHEIRTCYQRDRDRVVHSEAFRKLEYKTQVFVIYEGDYYRTRLTHTIEVAQIARTIGRSLQLNEDLIEAIALAHDLGHPPFGHAGEKALNHIMASAKPKLKFNHNQRSFDIVAGLEKRYPDFDGLNLTKEVLVGILKHSTGYDKPGDSHYNKFVNEGPTLEAKVVDIADSLAYLSHDIDDGITSRCITGDDLKASRLWKKAGQRVDPQLEANDKEIFKYQIVKALIDMQMKDLLSFSKQKLEKLNFKSSEEVRQYTYRNPSRIVIGFSPLMNKEREVLQKILEEKLYQHYRVIRMTDKAKRIIKDLFKVYMKTPEQLPEKIFRRGRKYTKNQKYKIICNHIASMTDRFAIDEHKKLFDPDEKV
ncbi:MAG: deoxyguanosinetriphosphate triphosphohydrolase [Candidatus Omnitrophica bacterium]|nr:deoxyguanosinetriphosphate triphosphohydrolase [Candidatus Omnitrophota bacterium]